MSFSIMRRGGFGVARKSDVAEIGTIKITFYAHVVTYERLEKLDTHPRVAWAVAVQLPIRH